MSVTYQEFDEPIAVEAVFSRRQICPRRLQWGNQTQEVATITYRWKEQKGEATVYFFALLTEEGTPLEICFNDKTLEWRLVRCWQEG